jgi:hypothetical protein
MKYRLIDKDKEIKLDLNRTGVTFSKEVDTQLRYYENQKKFPN